MLKTLNVVFLGFVMALTGCGGGSSSNTNDVTDNSVMDDVVDTSTDPVTDPAARQYGIFKVLDNDSTVEMNGEITSNSLTNFQALLNNFANVNRIEIIECGGSNDDDVNLLVSKLVYDSGISTHLKDNGLIASGGVDFFLAGVKRSIGTNTQIGVHSWSDGTNEASDFPEGDSNHLPYIEYYKSVGFTQENAEDFYYFTINAATASDIYYMAPSEIDRYGFIRS